MSDAEALRRIWAAVRATDEEALGLDIQTIVERRMEELRRLQANPDVTGSPRAQTEALLSVLEWSRERLANTYRIAAVKSGADRDSWLEDASYWEQIVSILSASPGSPRAQTEEPIEAIRAFMAKWPEVERIINGYFSLTVARTGAQYSGPSLAPELERFKAILSASPGSPWRQQLKQLPEFVELCRALDDEELERTTDSDYDVQLSRAAKVRVTMAAHKFVGALSEGGSPWRPKEEQEERKT